MSGPADDGPRPAAKPIKSRPSRTAGFVELFRRRRTALARYAAAIVAPNVLLFVFYFHQAGRLMAPVGATLIIVNAVGPADATRALLQRLCARVA